MVGWPGDARRCGVGCFEVEVGGGAVWVAWTQVRASRSWRAKATGLVVDGDLWDDVLPHWAGNVARVLSVLPALSRRWDTVAGCGG